MANPVRAAVVVSLVALGGCGGERSDTAATLRVDLVTVPGSGDLERTIAAATQVGLVGFDGRGEVVPALASSWRIAGDGQSVIFRLRPRVWPDGRPVTAADVVASFRRVAAPASRNRARPLLAALANGAAVLRGTLPPSALGIDAPVDNVVEVRAAGAMPGLLALLAQPGLAVVAPGPRPPALGPLRLADAARRPILLTRNPAAPADATRLGAVALTPTDDPGPAIARFAHDRTDVVIGGGLAGFDDARLLAASNALRVEPAWGVYGYLVHAAGPLADPRVRRALAMAVDRDDLGSRLFGVAMAPVLGLVPALPSEPAPALPDWAIQAPAARLDLARQLLAAAGFDAGHPLTVTISLPDAREPAAIAAEVASDWTRIGVTTRTVVRSPAALALDVARGTYELAAVERTAPLDSALAFLTPFACGGSSGTYCNPGADALVAAARTATDPAAAATTLGAAEAAMVADTPMIALFAPVRWALVSPRVSGWTANAAGQHPLALLAVSGRGAGP
jgi:ABC-type transport system substrate-binding protein